MIDFRMSRRTLLSAMGASAAAAPFLGSGRANAAVSEIVWATWDSNGHPEYVAAFEKETGVKVKLSYLNSEDAQFASMKTGAASTGT